MPIFFLNNSNYPVGLDISDLSIKVVQLNKIRGKIKIQAIGKIDLSPDIIDDGEILNMGQLAAAIKKLMANLKYGKINTDEVIVNLPENKTFIKLIEISKTPNPLAETISLEIEKHIPMSINEIYYDWQIIEDKIDQQLVLIGAAPKTIVNQYIELLASVKLTPVAMEIESISLCRSLLKEEFTHSDNTKSSNYGIIDISAQNTNMTIYSKNTVLFTVSMPISGEGITKKIAKELAIEINQAEKAKIICGLDEGKAQGIIKNILSKKINELTDKISEAVEFYHNHFPDRGTLNEIILCGGGANIKNLDKIISDKIGIKVKAGDALINLTEAREKFSKILTETHKLDDAFFKNGPADSPAISIEQDESLNYACSIGLALRGFFIDEF